MFAKSIQSFSVAYLFSLTLALPSSADGVWAKQFAGALEGSPEAGVLDSANNIITVGYFLGTADFDPGPGVATLTASGTNPIAQDIFVCKLNSDGNYVWAKLFEGPNSPYEWVTGVAVDDSDNIIITGSFEGTVDFDPGAGVSNLTSVGLSDIFVCKLSAGGSLVWVKQFGGLAIDWGAGVTYGAANSVYITGGFSGTADFDPGPGTFNMTTTTVEREPFILKLDSNGNLIWAKQIQALSGSSSNGHPSRGIGNGVSLDGSGNVYSVGSFHGTFDFDPGPGTHFQSSGTFVWAYANIGMYVSKLDTNGDFVSVMVITGGVNQIGGGHIIADELGNFYISGSYTEGNGQSIDFDPGPGVYNVPYSGQVFPEETNPEWSSAEDPFVAKYTSEGELVWAKAVGSGGGQFDARIAVDHIGNCYFASNFYWTADLNPDAGILNATAQLGEGDVFLIKLDTLGDFAWAKHISGTRDEYAMSVMADQTGSVYLVGMFAETTDFDPSDDTYYLTSAGGHDVYIAKYFTDAGAPNEHVRIVDASWSDQVDDDGDGYFRQMVLNWELAVEGSASALSVKQDVYWKPSASDAWNLLAKLPDETIFQPEPNSSSLFVSGHPFGTYDYRIEVRRAGQTDPDDIRDFIVDSDLDDHPEEDYEGLGPGSVAWRVFVPFFSDPAESLIDGEGPRTGRATVLNVQNLGAEATQLNITYQWREQNSTDFRTKKVFCNLAANGSVRWRPYRDESWELNGGIPIVGNSDEIAGSATIVADQPIVGFVSMYDFGFHGFAAYTMPSAGSTILAVPFVSDAGSSVNPGDNTPPTGTATFIGVQNLSASNTAEILPNYWTAQGENQLGPLGFHTLHPYPLLALAGVSWRPAIQDLAEGYLTGMRVRGSLDGRGPALVTSDQLVCGRVLRFDFGLGEIAAFTMPPAENKSKLFVPFYSDSELLKPEDAGVATFIGIQNLSDSTVTLDVVYRDPKIGAIQNLNEKPAYMLAPRAAVSWRPYANDPVWEGDATGSQVDGSSVMTGTAIISANGPIAGQVVSFDLDIFDRDGGATQLDSFSAYTTPTDGSTALTVPYFFDEATLKTDQSGKATFVSIQNLNNFPITIQVDYRDALGVLQNKNDFPNYVIAANGAVSWRPLADDPWEGADTGRLVPGSSVSQGNIVVTTSGGLIAGRVEIFDFDIGAKAAYTMPSALPISVVLEE